MSKIHKGHTQRDQNITTQGNRAISQALEQADGLIESEQFDAAIELLEPLAKRYPRDGVLQTYLGLACSQMGDLWQALAYYRRGMQLLRDPELRLPLGLLYLSLGFPVLAKECLSRDMLKQLDPSQVADAEHDLMLFEKDIDDIAASSGLPVKTVIEGLRCMEEGQIALQMGEFQRCIYENRRGIRLMKDFPPLYNNLSQALFLNGQPQEAIRTVRAVLERHPENIQAKGNLIHYLAWTGQEDEACKLWVDFRQLTPGDDSKAHKMIETAAVMEDDEMVMQLLKSIDLDEAEDQELAMKFELFWAVAEANLHKPSARKRLSRLKDENPFAREMLESLKANKAGMGWSGRFPYFHFTELMPRQEMLDFFNLIDREFEKPAKQTRKQIEITARRYPQVALMGKKILLEEQKPEVGIRILETIGTSQAFSVLRQFALGQAGSDEARMEALHALQEAEQIAADEDVRMWLNGKWQEIRLREQLINDDVTRDYSPQTLTLLEQALKTMEAGQSEEAEKLFKRVLELEPRGLEAYNNLGVIYIQRKQSEKGKAMFQKALEIDPGYVMARCNLAIFLIDDDQIEAAEEMLKPAIEAPSFTSQEFAFLNYEMARIAIYKGDFSEARILLERLLEIAPDFKPAKELFDRIDLIELMKSGMQEWREQSRKRWQATRQRQQKLLTTKHPTILDALGIYTREAMTGMGRHILRYGGWSTMKKTELHHYLAEQLQDAATLSALVEGLQPEERQALGAVLEHGGCQAWAEFDQQYGNDLDESPYWQFTSHVPETTMGRLRVRGLLAEATVDGMLYLTVPVELRTGLEEALRG